MEFRTEHDSLGDVQVPADRLWGAQTERSVHNFPIGRRNYVWGRDVIWGFGVLKKACALANQALGQLPEDKVRAIVAASEEVIAGKWDAEFPLVVFQTGSGTQSNMNANEVIARRAGQIAEGLTVHPNDDVNHGQSSNDTFPAVMHIAAVQVLVRQLLPAVRALAGVFRDKALAFDEVVMTGRTHLQDATPIRLGQVISGWEAQLTAAGAGIEAALPALYELAIGGTAVGTGLNAHPNFGATVAEFVALETEFPFVTAKNKFAALSAHDAVVAASGALRVLAGAAMKIANDVRWYASGPRTGIGELLIPENEPGSSIMPGKINPTQCEALTMVCVQVFGNDHAVAFAGSQGNFQLNVFKPVMLHNLLDSAYLLADALGAFTEHCAVGIEPALPRIEENLAKNLMLVTALNPHIGYATAAKTALLAHRTGISLREAALQLGVTTEQEFDDWVRPEEMTGPLKVV
jgi:fumarate hydratase class II